MKIWRKLHWFSEDFIFLEIQTTDPKVIIFNELFQGWHHLGERLAGSDGFDNEGIPWITMGTVLFQLGNLLPKTNLIH